MNRLSGTYPSVEQCVQLMEEYTMLENIRAHSHVVSLVAVKLHSSLSASLDPDLIPSIDLLIAGALLHDIAKTRCLQEGCNHAQVGAEICRHHGLDDIAEIVEEHVILQEFNASQYQKGIFQAKEIIFYADKRVLHDKIVSLPQRLEYILERYGQNDPHRHSLIKKNFSRCVELEKWICLAVGKNSDTLLIQET